MKQACGRLRRADTIFIAVGSLQVEGSLSNASLSSCNKKTRDALMSMLHAAVTVSAGGLAHTNCQTTSCLNIPDAHAVWCQVGTSAGAPTEPTCCAAGGAVASLVPLL